MCNTTIKNHQRGVGLIEILIAVVIMSIGLLAAARMQVEGMRFSQSAYYQSQAHFLANDMIDRMRSNIPGVTAGNYSGAKTSSSASNPACNTKQCDSQGVAQQDLYDWSANLHPLITQDGFIPILPSSTGSTAYGEIVDMGGDIFAVVLYWNEIVDGEDTQQNLRIQFALESQ